MPLVIGNNNFEINQINLCKIKVYTIFCLYKKWLSFKSRLHDCKKRRHRTDLCLITNNFQLIIHAFKTGGLAENELTSVMIDVCPPTPHTVYLLSLMRFGFLKIDGKHNSNNWSDQTEY